MVTTEGFSGKRTRYIASRYSLPGMISTTTAFWSGLPIREPTITLLPMLIMFCSFFCVGWIVDDFFRLSIPPVRLINKRTIDHALVKPTLASIGVKLHPIHSDTITDSGQNVRHRGPCQITTNLHPVTNVEHHRPLFLLYHYFYHTLSSCQYLFLEKSFLSQILMSQEFTSSVGGRVRRKVLRHNALRLVYGCHPSAKGETSSPQSRIAAYCCARAALRSGEPGLPTFTIIKSSPPL